MINTKILSGKTVADSVKNDLKNEVSKLLNQNVIPKLSAIIVGDDPASLIYVNTKHKTFKKFNCESEINKFDNKVSEEKIINFINKLNEDNSVHGILVQLPLPKSIDSEKVLHSISPNKDVDGFHPLNLGLLLKGSPKFIPCTPLGCLEILKYYNIDVQTKHVVIIGRSNIVGKPLMNLLSGKYEIGNSTVTLCHSRTKNLKKYTVMADILISAVGKKRTINRDMIKKGAIILDVGINRITDKNSNKGYSIVGDVDFESVIGFAGAITPVPGGVGPMTISMLLYNTIKSAKLSN